MYAIVIICSLASTVVEQTHQRNCCTVRVYCIMRKNEMNMNLTCNYTRMMVSHVQSVQIR